MTSTIRDVPISLYCESRKSIYNASRLHFVVIIYSIVMNIIRIMCGFYWVVAIRKPINANTNGKISRDHIKCYGNLHANHHIFVVILLRHSVVSIVTDEWQLFTSLLYQFRIIPFISCYFMNWLLKPVVLARMKEKYRCTTITVIYVHFMTTAMCKRLKKKNI